MDELATKRQTEARPLSSPWQMDLHRLYGKRIVLMRVDMGEAAYSNHYIIRADTDGWLLVDRVFAPPGATRWRYSGRLVSINRGMVLLVEPTQYTESDVEVEEAMG